MIWDAGPRGMGVALPPSPQSLLNAMSGSNFGDLTALLYVQGYPRTNSSS